MPAGMKSSFANIVPAFTNFVNRLAIRAIAYEIHLANQACFSAQPRSTESDSQRTLFQIARQNKANRNPYAIALVNGSLLLGRLWNAKAAKWTKTAKGAGGASAREG